MKKILIVFALAFLAVSCYDMQPVYDNPEGELMEVKALNYVPTKAPVRDAVFPTDRSMQIAAYYKVADSEIPYGGTSKNYFPFTEFTYSSQKSAWTAAAYWPFNGSLSMLAYSTNDGSENLVPTSTTWVDASNYSKGVTMVLPDNSTKQVDVLFAGREDITKTSNTLVFKHALSWLEFRARCSVDGAITIHGLTLNNAAHSGTVTALRSVDDMSFTWSNLGDRKNYDIPTLLSLTTDYRSLGNGLMIPPQERIAADGSMVSLTLHYRLNNGGTMVDMQYTCPLETPAWEPGTKYVYNINMTLDAITVTAEVVPWIDGGERPVEVPRDASRGTTGKAFSVSPTKKVMISTANLYFDMVDQKYKLMEHAYDMYEKWNENVGPNYSIRYRQRNEYPNMARVSLFNWGAAGSMRTHVLNTTYPSGDALYELEDYGCGVPNAGTFSYDYDWGNNKIYSATGAQIGEVGTWKTLNGDQWNYLIYSRSDASSKYGVAQITKSVDDFVNGLIILPDQWTLPYGLTFTPGVGSWTQNTYTVEEWEQMEKAGAIFLPAAGIRLQTNAAMQNSYGGYWSTSSSNYQDAWNLSFFENMLFAPNDFGGSQPRACGQSIRLVRPAYDNATANQKAGTSGKAFSVGANESVFFASSNLCFDWKAQQLQLMANAYDLAEIPAGMNWIFIIMAPYMTPGSIVDLKVSLFGWGASEISRIPAKNTSTSIRNERAVKARVLDSESDWGLANDIYSASGALLGERGAFRTMTADEWNYLINSRPDYAEKIGTARIDIGEESNPQGFVILPDEWTLPDGCTFTPGGDSWSIRNTYTSAQWELMQAAGAVFLPAAGNRSNETVGTVPSGGFYWTSNWGENTNGNPKMFNFNGRNVQESYGSACSVRLVRDAN